VTAAVQYVGHGTCVIDVDGTRLVTDPVLRRSVLHLRRVVPLDGSRTDHVDAVLISHAHHDHLDLPSLLGLGRGVRIIVPRGVGRLLARRGFRAVTVVEAGDAVTVGAVRVRAIPSAHAGARPPFVLHAAALGYVVEGSVKTYFAGDTDLFAAMSGLVAELDVALLPVWGWGLKLGSGLHLDPARAAEAVALLRPRIAVPIHWGTLLPAHRGWRALPATLRDPPTEFAAAVRRRSPEVEVRVLAPGEATVIGERS
jgi:L-ascorbate metabolism protein UlaG (beta-lactamase superfamily)